MFATQTRWEGAGALATITTLLAPTVGYAYGGIPKAGLRPLGRRLIVLGATGGAVSLLCGSGTCPVFGPSEGNAGVAAMVGLAGTLTFVVMTVSDVVHVSRAVRENNAKRVAVTPAWIPSSRAVGLAVKIGF